MAYVPHALVIVPDQNRKAMMHGRVQMTWIIETKVRSFSHSLRRVMARRQIMCPTL